MERKSDSLKKSSKNGKKNVDEISRETQRLVSEAHVHLPYHKPKQKTLKDFLNRTKMSSECQVSITGSKKHLQKAWEFIENKEKNVEKFYSEDCSQNDDDEKLLCSNNIIQDRKTITLDTDEKKNRNEGHFSEKKKDIILSKIDDDEKMNDEQNSIVGSESSINDIVSSFNTDDSNDEEKNTGPTLSSAELSFAETPPTQVVTQQNNEISNDLEKQAGCKDTINKKYKSKKKIMTQFIKRIDSILDKEQNIHKSIDESDKEEEEFFIKRKSKLIILSESSDDEENDDDENDDNENNDELITKIKLTPNFNALFNESQTKISTQQLMSLCSGEFKTQQSEDCNQSTDDDFDSEVPLDNLNSSSDDDTGKVEEEESEIPKLISVKDFFDDEAELSESDWSSDEENLVNVDDKLEEEDGDKDQIDDDIVKTGLDKIFRRQLLDDDQNQVNVLKEMLLEDGDLHSDSGRKRKFQWSEADEKNDTYKRPLFSDNDDDDEDDDIYNYDSIDDWRKERLKRESYYVKKSKYDEQFNDDAVSCDILQTAISVVKKTHIVKYQNEETKDISNEFDNSPTIVTTTITDVGTEEKPQTSDNSFADIQLVNTAACGFNKTLKGSFMRHINSSQNKMATALMYVNQSSSDDKMNEAGHKRQGKTDWKKTATKKKVMTNRPITYLLKKLTESENVEEKGHGIDRPSQ